MKCLQRFMILFFIELSSRRVQLKAIAKCPNGFWMEQGGRNVTDREDGVLKTNRYLIYDRDPLYTTQFLIRAQSGVESVRLPPRFSQLERFRRALRQVDQGGMHGAMIFLSEGALRTAVREFLAHHHADLTKSRSDRVVHRKQRLGSPLSYHHRDAAYDQLHAASPSDVGRGVRGKQTGP